MTTRLTSDNPHIYKDLPNRRGYTLPNKHFPSCLIACDANKLLWVNIGLFVYWASCLVARLFRNLKLTISARMAWNSNIHSLQPVHDSDCVLACLCWQSWIFSLSVALLLLSAGKDVQGCASNHKAWSHDRAICVQYSYPDAWPEGLNLLVGMLMRLTSKERYSDLT